MHGDDRLAALPLTICILNQNILNIGVTDMTAGLGARGGNIGLEQSYFQLCQNPIDMFDVVYLQPFI